MPNEAQPMNPTSRAYIIGDQQDGLTIVFTNPVYVAHYSAKDLLDQNVNRIITDPKNPTPVGTTMAAIVQELISVFRYVDQNKASIPGSYDPEELTREQHYANTISRLIGNGSSVYDVDFCLALNVDPNEFVMRGRATNPATAVMDDIAAYIGGGSPGSVPKKPNIDYRDTTDLGELPIIEEL